MVLALVTLGRQFELPYPVLLAIAAALGLLVNIAMRIDDKRKA